MWLSFWRSRQRFSLDELRYLTEQLQKVQIVTDINKDFVIEALRSIAELVTYGDQHDPTFFEFFMEKQVMGEFIRILKISRTVTVPLQLLQTMSIMIQNLRSEHAIYYIFSNEHINSLITYSFDFRNEELLSYYISFLRAISGKLDKNTISLLVKTQNEEIVSFPLYIEAIKFAFHDENMVRTAVRALTLNVYHVGDESVNGFVTSPPLADYFFDLVAYFRKQCINLDGLVSEATKSHSPPHLTSIIPAAVDEIEDNLYYFSDVISAGVANLGRLITDNILQLLVFPLLLSSIKLDSSNFQGRQIGAATSLYLLCCILRIVKTKDLASSIAAALFCPSETFIPRLEQKPNGHVFGHNMPHKNQQLESGPPGGEVEQEHLRDAGETSPGPSKIDSAEDFLLHHNCSGSNKPFREVLLSYVVNGDEIQVSGSLSVLATLLQTKELDESMLDALGILPQRKQHKKLLLQALMGEGSGEDQLFSSENNLMKDGICNELDTYLLRLKDHYGLPCSCNEPGTSPRLHRYQVLDVLVGLFCRPNVSAETLWLGGWLLRQLLPYSEQEFNSHHLKILQDAYKNCSRSLLMEVKGSWCDLLITVIIEEWKKCKKAIEASSPHKDPRCLLLPPGPRTSESESCLAAGERMWEVVKLFVLHHQLQVFSVGGTLPDQPHIHSPIDSSVNSRAKRAGLDVISPRPGIEINLVDAIPCRIAFERGKERHFFFLAIFGGTAGWVLLAEELPLKLHFGVVRVAAPLAGSNPRIDDKHPKWLHVRIRPSILPFMDSIKSEAPRKAKAKGLIDGRWTLAFRDEDSCKSAESMILEEMHLQSSEVDKSLRTAFDLDTSPDKQGSCSSVSEDSSSTPAYSL